MTQCCAIMITSTGLRAPPTKNIYIKPSPASLSFHYMDKKSHFARGKHIPHNQNKYIRQLILIFFSRASNSRLFIMCLVMKLVMWRTILSIRPASNLSNCSLSVHHQKPKGDKTQKNISVTHLQN